MRADHDQSIVTETGTGSEVENASLPACAGSVPVDDPAGTALDPRQAPLLPPGDRPRVAIIGGGLAGVAAAAELIEHDCRVDLFEARQRLGGRASSFRDPQSGALIDFCQHVSMGCCSELACFFERVGIERHFERHRVLYFIGTNGRCYRVRGNRWLPPPLHLAGSLLKLGFLSIGERLRIGPALLQLVRYQEGDNSDAPAIDCWLRQHRQSEQALDRFWGVVLVSALGETLDRISVPAARKVFCDAFLDSRDGYEVLVPDLPFTKLFDCYIQPQLEARGVTFHLGTAVEALDVEGGGLRALRLQAGKAWACDYAILACPWKQSAAIADRGAPPPLPELASAARLESSPITGLHLWFDRPITALPHAVLVGRLSQWLFNRGPTSGERFAGRAHYYQVVISASRQLIGRPPAEVTQQVCGELAELFPQAVGAKLLHYRVVTEKAAVFSPLPGSSHLRPPQHTAIPNLALAGDWTRTGWPATMESAVRSGRQAARIIAKRMQQQMPRV